MGVLSDSVSMFHGWPTSTLEKAVFRYENSQALLDSCMFSAWPTPPTVSARSTIGPELHHRTFRMALDSPDFAACHVLDSLSSVVYDLCRCHRLYRFAGELH